MTESYDVFICHASEDKVRFVEPLVMALLRCGLSVWYDRFAIGLGDDFRQKMSEGLRGSRFGVVVVTRFSFKYWPQAELSALFNQEAHRHDATAPRILPVRCDLTMAELTDLDPLLAGRRSIGWEDGVDTIARQIAEVVRKHVPTPVGQSTAHLDSQRRAPALGRQATAGQQLVVDAALSAMLAQPGSGAQQVSGSELRFALRDMNSGRRDEAIRSCVPHFLVPAAQGDMYQPTLDALLNANDARTARALEVSLALIADRYSLPGGRRQRALLWSDIRARGEFEQGDFDVVWHTLTIGQVAGAGRPPPGASDSPVSPRYDYEFWLREHDLEGIHEHRDVESWATLQRARHASAGPMAPAPVSAAPVQQLRIDGQPPARGRGTAVPTDKTIDLGIVIALPEELKQLLDLVPTYQRHPAKEIDAYVFVRGRYRCAVVLVGEMGETQAGVFTERLISELDPFVIVSMGIAGGLNDLRPGDVHVPAQSVQYIQDSKASAISGGGFEIVPGAPAYRSDYSLLRAARTLQFDHPEQFEAWGADAAADFAALLPDDGKRRALIDGGDVRAVAALIVDGHVATGPTVGAAKAFADWIRTHDRNVKSLEMESAAVLLSAQTRTEPRRALVIRAISDFGDERKKELDAKADGVLRRYSMRNAIRLLWALLDSDALPRRASAENPLAGEAVDG